MGVHTNLTEGTPHCLLQPHENIAHTYSFDIGIPHSHKNIASLNSLQQQVLENQKIIMRLQSTHSDSKKTNKRKYGNLRQNGVMVQSTAVPVPGSNHRSKSSVLKKGINNLLTKLTHIKPLDHNSRQSFIVANQTYNKNNNTKLAQNKENMVASSNTKYKKKNSSILNGMPAAFKNSNKKLLGGGGV